jgi:hypothetical protein
LPPFISRRHKTFCKNDGIDGIDRKSFHKIACCSEPKLLIGRLARNRDMSIFETSFDASTGRWIAFNEETLTSLSEHDTKADALNACRRYFEREMRRANILRYLTRHAA